MENKYCLSLVCLALFHSLLNTAAALAVEPPTTAIDYSKLAFYPQRWADQGISTQMYAWQGNQIVLLTPEKSLPTEAMDVFVGYLDQAWAYYRDTTGGKPRTYKALDGKPTIAAVPNASLTCGIGCGMVGATGIEVGKFPSDLAEVRRDANAFPHYYFYEMGRNYYIYGKKHDCFVTGYAVFMRYGCMDKLGVKDNDAATRRAIENAIDTFAKSKLDFISAMTNSGSLSEKQPRFKGYAGPCDQPVMYASAMLRLRRDYGGERFVQRFYHALHDASANGEKDDMPGNAQRQSVIWMLVASHAAKENLTSLFVDQWRLELSADQRRSVESIDWRSDDFDLRKVIDDVLN